MRFPDYLTDEKNRLSLFRIFLIFISPIVVSLLIHLSFLYYSHFIRWRFIEHALPESTMTATVILDGEADNKLRFQGTDTLESFDAQDDMVYPLPDVEYRPVSPDVEFFPEPKVSQALDLISVDAASMDNAWVNPSTGRQPLYTGAEKLVGSFSRHIQVLREGGLDVVFVFDATVSMARYIKRVKFKITNLAKTYKKLVPTCRIGMVAYRDRGEAFVTKTHPLTYGIITLQNFLSGIDAEGGGDREEAVEEALRVAVDEIKWNEKAKKIILLMGDAPPREENMDHAMGLIKKFREQMGGRLAALDTRIPIYNYYDSEESVMSETGLMHLQQNREVMDEFRIFSELGGGECARMVDEEKVIKQMLVLVFGVRWEMYLNEFMKNL